MDRHWYGKPQSCCGIMAAEIVTDADLGDLSTFRLPARARELAFLDNAADLPDLLETDLPLLLLGGGSNTLFLADFPGRVVVNRLAGIDSEVLDRDRVQVTVAAGEDWHGLVRWSLDRGLWGLENLALIPGSVGAAPMQNIGAYGVELAHCLDAVQVFDRENGDTGWLAANACGLGYRTSRFKTTDRDRFVILAVRLELEMHGTPVLDYPSLAEELSRHRLTNPNAREIAAAVIRVRTRKLPDPSHVANAGSFFRNPVVAVDRARALLEEFPELPHWPEPPGRVKLSAGWMIDHLGWRGKSVGDAAVFDNHALVLINRGNATGNDVLKLARAIRDDVGKHFGVELEPEPLLVGGSIGEE